MQLPDFKFERRLWEKGYRFVAGADEVGRGSFAGPVVAATVILDQNTATLPGQGIIVNDSKKLSSKQREKAGSWIKESVLDWGIGQASVSEINRLGLSRATQRAFRRAVAACSLEINYLLVDAFFIPYLKGLNKNRQKPIKKGDSLSFSIAAASILAKVRRDKILSQLGKKQPFKKYGWERNKGYGTKEHREAILKHGITSHHRRKFTDSFFSRVQSDA